MTSRVASAGAEVEITHGLTKDLDGSDLDVTDLEGVVEDPEGYVNEDTGDHMVGVRATEGGGLAMVPEQRLRTRGRTSFGLSAQGRANFDDIFNKRIESRRRA